MASDPIKSGLNWYLYCYANPTTFFDPDGREPVKIGEADSPWIETGNFFMNDQYIRTKVSKETGTVYGNLYDMVHSVGGTTWASAKDPFRGKDITHFYAVTETAKFVYKNSTLEYHRKEPYSVIFSDFLDSGNGTRDGDVFVPMDYFAKLMCNTIGVNKPIWGQKLISPAEKVYVSAGYKLDSYLDLGRGTHYAMDFYGSSNKTPPLYATVVGTVMGNYTYGSLGLTLAIKYNNVIANDGQYYDSIIIRYSHLESIEEIAQGNIVGSETKVATMGASGEGAKKKIKVVDEETGEEKTIVRDVYHTHMEVSTDTKKPLSTITERRRDESKKALDTTIDPQYIFFAQGSRRLPPDTELGGSPKNNNGLPWYDEAYLRLIADTPLLK